ncbi:hypothetical protein [Calothrix rhizosoleniae]
MRTGILITEGFCFIAAVFSMKTWMTPIIFLDANLKENLLNSLTKFNHE